MSVEWWSVLIAGMVLFLGLIGHIIASIWWASRITVLVEGAQISILNMANAFKDMTAEIKAFGSVYARKDDVVREMTLMEKQIQVMWDKLDKLKERFDGERK